MIAGVKHFLENSLLGISDHERQPFHNPVFIVVLSCNSSQNRHFAKSCRTLHTALPGKSFPDCIQLFLCIFPTRIQDQLCIFPTKIQSRSCIFPTTGRSYKDHNRQFSCFENFSIMELLRTGFDLTIQILTNTFLIYRLETVKI